MKRRLSIDAEAERQKRHQRDSLAGNPYGHPYYSRSQTPSDLPPPTSVYQDGSVPQMRYPTGGHDMYGPRYDTFRGMSDPYGRKPYMYPPTPREMAAYSESHMARRPFDPRTLSSMLRPQPSTSSSYPPYPYPPPHGHYDPGYPYPSNQGRRDNLWSDIPYPQRPIDASTRYDFAQPGPRRDAYGAGEERRDMQAHELRSSLLPPPHPSAYPYGGYGYGILPFQFYGSSLNDIAPKEANSQAKGKEASPLSKEENTVSKPSKKQRRVCVIEGCTKFAQGITRCCTKHGGGKRCLTAGCGKGAVGATTYCVSHGGGKRCQKEECGKSAIPMYDFCFAHGGGRRCAFKGCTKGARATTEFCIGHGGGKRCKVKSCSKSDQGAGYCIAHGGGRRRKNARTK